MFHLFGVKSILLSAKEPLFMYFFLNFVVCPLPGPRFGPVSVSARRHCCAYLSLSKNFRNLVERVLEGDGVWGVGG